MKDIIDRDGFEARAWSRRLWVSLLNAELNVRYNRALLDGDFDFAIDSQAEIAAHLDRLRYGLRPSFAGDWIEWFERRWTAFPNGIKMEKQQ